MTVEVEGFTGSGRGGVAEWDAQLVRGGRTPRVIAVHGDDTAAIVTACLWPVARADVDDLPLCAAYFDVQRNAAVRVLENERVPRGFALFIYEDA